MQNLGIVTFNDNIDNIIKARQCISSNNIVVFVKEEHERDIQRCNKGTDIHIKFLREIEDYRGKLDMLMFLSAPVDFIYSKISIAKKIAVTNNVLLQLGNYKIESTVQIANHLFLVIEPTMKREEVKIIVAPVASEKTIDLPKEIVIEAAPIIETIEEKKEEVIVEVPVEKIIAPKSALESVIANAEPEPVVIIEEQAIAPVEEIIEIVEEAILSSEPAVEIVQTPEVEIVEPVIERIEEVAIEAKEEIKIKTKVDEPKEDKRFAKKRGRK